MKKKQEMVHALAKELQMRSKEFHGQTVETIYFGGGTPSVLAADELNLLMDSVVQNYQLVQNPEITLEANPDDFSEQRILEWSQNGINRLSVGVQSFFEDDLKLMHRAHNADQAKTCLSEAKKYFDNISIDLIYGIPGSSHEKWLQNIETALSFDIPHISSYALTVEPKTALKKLIATGSIAQPSDELAQEQFHLLVGKLQSENFVHYELSNFGKEGYFSRNNSAYWLGKKYLGIGPSAHSYDGNSRSWNIANNALYLKSMAQNELPSETEILTPTDRYNEYIMTGLRTIWGVDMQRIQDEFGAPTLAYLQKQTQKFLADGLLSLENHTLKTTSKGKFLTDGIASDLFLINLE